VYLKPRGWETNLHENDRGGDGHETIELHQHPVFVVLAVAVQEDLLDALDRELFVLERHLMRVRRELGRILDNLWWKGGGEEDDLDVSR